MKSFLKGTSWLAGLVAWSVSLESVRADDGRRFTYSYEPETEPAGETEFEQWITLGTQRTAGGEVKQGNYNRWQFREELEYGVTSNYTVSLYLNTATQSYRDDGENPPADRSKFTFEGLSVENRYRVLDPARYAVGLALYLEPRYAGDTAEVEQRIILGQRYGRWKWALNLTHATEWEEQLHRTEGEAEISFGLARDLSAHWSLGLEGRDHNELPAYARWENTAFFLGPVLSYRGEEWWAALTVMPQICGANFINNPHGDSQFELEGHERLNIRLVLGFEF